MKRLVKFFTAAALLFLSLPAGALAATPAPSPTPASANSNGDLHSIIYGTQFYDPNDCTGSSGTPTSTGIDHNLPGKNPEDQVMIFLVTQMNYTPEQAAGFAGNFKFESGFDPTATNPSGAHGIVQWLGSRLSDPAGNENSAPYWGLVQFAQHNNLQEDTLTAQLNFVKYELTHGFGPFNKTEIEPYPHDLQTVNEKVYLFYEAPGDGTDGARYAFGQQILKDYNNWHPGGVGSTGNGGDSCSTAATGNYVSPFCNGIKIESGRIDQGVDYGAPLGGDICAMGNGTVITVSQPHPAWPGYIESGWMTYRLADGPGKGLIVYMSEDCTFGNINAGDTVKAGQVICHMPPGYNVIETGWAQEPANGTIAMAHYWYVEGMPTIFGQNFSDFIKAAGGPPGDISASHGPRDIHTLPNACPSSDPWKCWPTWK
jgi:hypothetical protein